VALSEQSVQVDSDLKSGRLNSGLGDWEVGSSLSVDSPGTVVGICAGRIFRVPTTHTKAYMWIVKPVDFKPHTN
jgi:hypothetical protein